MLYLALFRIISEHVSLLLKKFPGVVASMRTELSEFLSVTRNIETREAFYCQLVSSLSGIKKY